MAINNNKFFFLQLELGFFEELSIKKLESEAKGKGAEAKGKAAYYILILLRLMLLSLQADGEDGEIVKRFKSDTIIDELALRLGEDPALVQEAVQKCVEVELIIADSNDLQTATSLFFPLVPEMTKARTAEALKKQKQRANRKQKDEAKLAELEEADSEAERQRMSAAMKEIVKEWNAAKYSSSVKEDLLADRKLKLREVIEEFGEATVLEAIRQADKPSTSKLKFDDFFSYETFAQMVKGNRNPGHKTSKVTRDSVYGELIEDGVLDYTTTEPDLDRWEIVKDKYQGPKKELAHEILKIE